MSRVAGYALRQLGDALGGTITLVEGSGETTAVITRDSTAGILDGLTGTSEGGPNTGRTDPGGIFPTLAAPYWYAEDGFTLTAVMKSAATSTNWPRMRYSWPPDPVSYHYWYPVTDRAERYSGGTWETWIDGTGDTIRPGTNRLDVGTAWFDDYDGTVWGLYDGTLGYYNRSWWGRAHILNYSYYGTYFAGDVRYPASVEDTAHGYDFPAWQFPDSGNLRFVWYYDSAVEPNTSYVTEDDAPRPSTGVVEVTWSLEWWLVARVYGPDGCDDWTDDGGVTPEPSESVALVSDWTGFTYRAYVAGDGYLYAQRRTRPTGTFTTRALISGGTQPALSVRPDGRARCLYVDGPDVLARNLDTDEDEYVATGSYPREIWLRHGGLRVLTYCASGTVYAAVTDAQDNTLYGGPVTVATGVDAQAFDVVERPDGKLEGWLSVSGTLTQYRSSDNGRTWST